MFASFQRHTLMKLIKGQCIFLLLWPFYAISDIVVGADDWEGYTHQDGSGIYFDLMRKIYPEQKLIYQIEPFNRVKQGYKQGKVDVILGVYPNEIQSKVLPKWPIDLEDPVVAFYDSRKINFNHISDIERYSVSWVRGYDFDQYLPIKTSQYDVDHPSVGFKLLLNNRVDAFIDYAYNRPKGTPDYIKSFELLPARKVYAAFQSNIRGKKLAAQFDVEIEKLMASGELAAIYGDVFSDSGFEQPISNQQKVVLFTDERDLLGIKNNALIKSHSSLYQVAMLLKELLPEYQFVYRHNRGVETALNQAKEPAACILNAVKTPAREQAFLFSQPLMLYQGVRLYSPTALAEQTRLNLAKLLAEHTELTLGVHAGRSYGAQVDDVIKALDKDQVFYTPNDEISAIKQLAKGRFDLLIESPIVFNGYWSQLNNNMPLYHYELTETAAYLTGHLLCKANKDNGVLIEKVDAALAQLYQSGAFYKAQRALMTDIHLPSFQQAYRENFAH
ncbi:hypothetical protein [Thalassotalea sp. PLHSN55]|uniref:hypothetical protein n=1 Tax=Thalassotalea sp. PLHSN55 TaxID=3435888 RepID=UPI003F86CE68